MKIISMLFFVLLPFLLIAADVKDKDAPKGPSTRLEEFISKKGELIIKDFYATGRTLNGNYNARANIKALALYRPGQEKNKQKGFIIEVTEGGKYEKSNRSYLDFDEIESLSKALNYLLELSGKWEKENKEHVEVVFLTKGDFKLGLIQVESKQTFFLTSGYIGETHCFIENIDEMKKLKEMIDTGIKILKDK